MHGHVLAADDRIAGEPVTIVLLRSIGRRIGSFDGDTIGRGVGTRERLDGHPQRGLKKEKKIFSQLNQQKKNSKRKLRTYRFVGVEASVGGIDFDAIGSDGTFEMEADTSHATVCQFDANFEEFIERSVVPQLVERDGFDVAGDGHCRRAKLRFERRSANIDCTMGERERQNDCFFRKGRNANIYFTLFLPLFCCLFEIFSVK